MSKREYAQEYLGDFVDSLFRYFPLEVIKRCCILKRAAFQEGRTYFSGWDLARMGEDESCGAVIDRTDRENLVQVENVVTRKTLTTTTEKNIIQLDSRFPSKKIYLDAGAGTLGVSIFDHLLDTSLRHKIVAINNRSRPLDMDANQKSKILKDDLYSNLLALMEQGKIKLLDDDAVRESLQSVQYEYLVTAKTDTRLHIFGNYTHIVEALIRACYCTQDKSLNLWAR
jgi:hypothetical protein